MVSTGVDTFLDTVRRSRLLSEATLQAARTAVGAESSGDALAGWLVAQGHLTTWQRDQLLQGKARGFWVEPYEIIGRLGAGGMAQVFLGRHRDDGTLAAVKLLAEQYLDHRSAVKRFQREADVVSKLDDPHIVRLLETGEADGRPFLALEYIDGRAVDQIVRGRGKLAPPVAAELARQAALGLAHAHDRGFIHRDIKPSNLLLGRDGRLRILDFGLASIGVSSRLTLDAEETILGTADYIAPEQAVNSHTVDRRCDLYSLGATLVFLLTGRPPFSGSVSERLRKHRSEPPPDVRTLRPMIPPALATIVHRLLEKSPEARYDQAEDLIVSLAAYLAEEPPVTPSDLAELARPAASTLDDDPLVEAAAKDDPILSNSAPSPVRETWPHEPLRDVSGGTRFRPLERLVRTDQMDHPSDDLQGSRDVNGHETTASPERSELPLQEPEQAAGTPIADRLENRRAPSSWSYRSSTMAVILVAAAVAGVAVAVGLAGLIGWLDDPNREAGRSVAPEASTAPLSEWARPAQSRDSAE